MEVSCSRRLARESGLDSFNPDVWTAFKRCTFREYTLEREIKEEDPSFRKGKWVTDVKILAEQLRRSCVWYFKLAMHRKYCEVCKMDATFKNKQGEIVKSPRNIFGMAYHKGDHQGVCLRISSSYSGRSFCHYCDDWKKFYFTFDPTPSMGSEIKHGDVIITLHLGPWIIKTYHEKCAIQIGVVSAEEMQKYSPFKNRLKANLIHVDKRVIKQFNIS
jgi:hypothetical protein